MHRSVLLTLTLTLVVLLTGFALVSCGGAAATSPEEAILGEWIREAQLDVDEPVVWRFLEDGTLSVREGNVSSIGEYSWAGDSTIRISVPPPLGPIEDVLDVSIAGDKMTLTDPQNRADVLVRFGQ